MSTIVFMKERVMRDEVMNDEINNFVRVTVLVHFWREFLRKFLQCATAHTTHTLSLSRIFTPYPVPLTITLFL